MDKCKKSFQNKDFFISQFVFDNNYGFDTIKHYKLNSFIMENIKNQIKIPYLSAAKMEKLMELVSQRSHTSISLDYFKNYGFGHADAYLAINTLKFLGIIDEDGKSMENQRKFQLRGDARNKEIQEILKSAYKKLFSTTSEPFNLSKDDLINEFMHNYSLSGRVAASAVPAFLKLCEFAGLVEQGSVLTRKRSTDKSDKKQSRTNAKKGLKSRIAENKSSGYVTIPIGKTEWRLPAEVLTKMAFGGDIAKDIESVTKHVLEFSEKYCKSGSDEELKTKETK